MVQRRPTTVAVHEQYFKNSVINRCQYPRFYQVHWSTKQRTRIVYYNRAILTAVLPRSILLDNMGMFYYSVIDMLNGIKIYSADKIWCQILAEMGATVSDVPDKTFLDFDSLEIPMPASPVEIKAAILNSIDGNIQLFRKIFGRNVQLPHIQSQIVILLYKSGGMSATDLRAALGYSPDATTHALDTAIYQLRKTFGREFIINSNGVYKIGRL